MNLDLESPSTVFTIILAILLFVLLVACGVVLWLCRPDHEACQPSDGWHPNPGERVRLIRFCGDLGPYEVRAVVVTVEPHGRLTVREIEDDGQLGEPFEVGLNQCWPAGGSA